MELFPGYTLEKLKEEDVMDAAYKVTGPTRVRITCPSCLGTGGIGHCNKCGASGKVMEQRMWYLHRNQVNKHMLFPIPNRPLSQSMSIRGYKWFTDRTGELKPSH